MAGRLAPFIELGVGFNPDLSGQDNVILNAVMMGLTPREARRRVDAVFDFAELDEFPSSASRTTPRGCRSDWRSR